MAIIKSNFFIVVSVYGFFIKAITYFYVPNSRGNSIRSDIPTEAPAKAGVWGWVKPAYTAAAVRNSGRI